MTEIAWLQPTFVEFIPSTLEPGVLYISRRYRTASHLCCSGCGLVVVTPINPAKWQLTEHGTGEVSLFPSIGNWSFPCKAHYWIERNQILWSAAMSEERIAEVQFRDRADSMNLYTPVRKAGRIRKALDWIVARLGRV